MIPTIQLTSAGAALLAASPAGAAVQLTRWQIGTGALPSGGSLDRTALVSPLEYLPLSSITNSGNTALVMGQYTNQGEESGFDWEELGLLATGTDGAEILFAYGNAYGKGEQIQPAATQLREFEFGAQLTFSAAASVTGVIDQGLVFIPLAEKGAAGGVAPLGEDGKVPEQYLPEISQLTAQVQVTYNGGGV